MNVVLKSEEFYCEDLVDFDNRFPPSMFEVLRVECTLGEFNNLLRSGEDFDKECVTYEEPTMSGSYVVRNGVCFQTHECYV